MLNGKKSEGQRNLGEKGSEGDSAKEGLMRGERRQEGRQRVKL